MFGGTGAMLRADAPRTYWCLLVINCRTDNKVKAIVCDAEHMSEILLEWAGVLLCDDVYRTGGFTVPMNPRP
jgi:hypothetical protein